MSGTVVFKTIVDTGGSEKTLGQLENRATNLNKQMREVPLGSKKFKELKQELIGVNKQIKNTELSMEALDNEQVASEIGSVAGAVGDMTAAFVLLGGGGGALEETAANIEKGLGITMAFKGAIEGVLSFQKLWNSTLKKTAVIQGILSAAQWVYTTAVGSSTGALKLLRIALMATGIGAIVVAIGLLIANFDKVKKAVMGVVSGTGKLGKTIQTILKIAFLPWYISILAIIKALKWLGIVDTEEALASYKLQKQKREQIDKQLLSINQLILKNKELLREQKKAAIEQDEFLQDSIEAGNKKIALANAEGKSKRELRKLEAELRAETMKNTKASLLKHKEVFDLLKDENEAIKEAGKGYEKMSKVQKKSYNDKVKRILKEVDALEGLVEVTKKIREDTKQAEKIANAERKARGKERAKLEKKAIYDLALAQKQADAEDITNARVKANKLIQIERFKLQEALKNTKLTNTQKELLIFNTEEAIDKIKEGFNQKEIDRRKELNQQINDEYNELLTSIEDLENAHSNRMTENLKRNEEIEINAIYDKYNAQIIALEERGESTKLLEEAQAADIAEINEKYRKQEIERDAEVQNAKVETVMQSIGALQGLTSAFAKDNEASQRKAFEINKKLQIAQALIQTYQGVQAIFATSAANPLSIPFPAYPYIQSGIALATGLANIQNIRKQQFSGGSAGGSFGSGGGGNFGGGQAPQLSPITNTSTLVPQEAQQVYVTETDISNTQNKVAVIEGQATIK